VLQPRSDVERHAARDRVDGGILVSTDERRLAEERGRLYGEPEFRVRAAQCERYGGARGAAHVAPRAG